MIVIEWQENGNKIVLLENISFPHNVNRRPDCIQWQEGMKIKYSGKNLRFIDSLPSWDCKIVDNRK